MINIEFNYISMIPIALILFSKVDHLSAKVDTTEIFVGDAYQVHSDTQGEDRLILIYTPDEYNYVENRYPVFYLLDACG